jgi:hypothetical protein
MYGIITGGLRKRIQTTKPQKLFTTGWHGAHQGTEQNFLDLSDSISAGAFQFTCGN